MMTVNGDSKLLDQYVNHFIMHMHIETLQATTQLSASSTFVHQLSLINYTHF